jgi:cysteine desulfurase
MNRIYLDHAATTPLDPVVLETMHATAQKHFGNPSSPHSDGQQSKAILEDSRKIVANSINTNSRELFFTASGTESNNFALIGTARAHRNNGNHIITSKIEHPSILETCIYLERNGFKISYVDVDKNGILNLSQLQSLINERTILVSIMLVNNETGCILPVEEIGNYLKETAIVFHCDAVQAHDKMDINVDRLNVDLLTISAHKIYGPKGIGALYIREKTKIDNIQFGGAQESGRRPGTENMIAIAGFARAVQEIKTNSDARKRLTDLRNLFEGQLKKAIPDIAVNGESAPRVPGYSNIYFPFISGEILLMNLDLEGVSVSTGSACSSGSQKPSHVLQSMGFDDKRVNNSVRFSMGRHTTEREILSTVNLLRSIYLRH